MKKVILAALALVPALAFANPGAYVQAQAGINAVDTNTNIGHTTGFVGGAGAGYLWGNNEIGYGLEVDALFYPNSKVTHNNVEYKYKGYNLSLLGIIKYTSCSTGFVIFGKAGGAYTHQDLTVEPNSASDNDIAPEAALGVGYQFNPNLEVDLTADEVFSHLGVRSTIPNNRFEAAQNGNLLLGVAYHFA